ncbi:unnamed protein product [Linum tenue]|uniref:3-beta hydroxysteroid dehydrogenase/isomerase domain-containing protein n=1 Tax=Linum tenue TaxID=586396 RepID=A0AAV0H8J3_9ROSI|nr:unnamed protein product [Linum tenue]
MHLSENEGVEGKVFVVTGGLGFVGSALCLDLVRRFCDCTGDITNQKDVGKALRGADCVFHLASYGMSGKEMLQKINSGQLYTCAIRPAAIYGPGEERHLPRIMSLAKLGLMPFRIGDPNVKTDWVYCDNLVRSPVNSFEFLQPLLKSIGYDIPKTILYPWLKHWWLPQPLILPAEVYKVGVTHYFSYLKGMAATISYWQKKKREMLDGPTIYAWLYCVIGMVIRLVAVLAIAAHLFEAMYAWKLAKKVDPANAKGWFWQTFALGFFSLRFLLKRAQN